MIRRLLQQIGLVSRGCKHVRVQNTGEQYTDKQYGFTVVMVECLDCGLVVISEV